jgi:hypothetical protein
MSIAIVVKVSDGIVLASDSASSLFVSDQHGRKGIINVYNHADKIFNLSKGKPIGMIGCGFGGIGGTSISTLTKDLRNRFMTENNSDWFLGEDYSMQDVAEKVRKYFFEEKYNPEYHDATEKPPIFIFIAGYSAKTETPEVWQVQILDGNSPDPILLRDQNSTGLNWGGETEAISRLIKSLSNDFPKVLKDMGVPDNQIEPALKKISEKLEKPLVLPAMPIQDAIDLARFLVTLTIEFVRFSPGAPTVGGPIELATITKHEGFKWIQRKYYYNKNLNP